MGTYSISKVTLYVLNTIYMILGLGIAATSIWFFCEVHDFTTLRNSNHYLLDYTVYWPQAIPWIFLIVSLIVIGVSCCGFTSVHKKSKGLITVFLTAQSIAILFLIAASVVALVFADNKATDDFVKDTVWDVYFQAKSDVEVADKFGIIERKLHCCGADSPRDYKNWKNEFPTSCCDVFYHGFLEPYAIDCEFTNKLANERHGCSTVAAQYARIVIKVLSGVSIFTAVIGITTLAVAVLLSRALEKRRRIQRLKNEAESKKVLL
ncbi:23 kDa integral membrane protein-like [Leptidea sinapis]|uniref:23 kDa integral membrane protein-like n=1 Tax=Leptidea sinapis TaxID=189913 RepID=UPI0021C45A60|nr:23 kDa integral membrane protein-like [Leptidea sinapis]